MAMLETLLKGMDNLEGYEQSELVNAARDIWIHSPRHKDEVVNVAAILDEMMKLEFLHPIAMLQLGRDKYSTSQLQSIYESLLDDKRSPYEVFYDDYVKEAVKFLLENHPEELEKVKTDLPWKKAIIDEALGRPPTLWRRDGGDQSEADEAIAIEF